MTCLMRIGMRLSRVSSGAHNSPPSQSIRPAGLGTETSKGWVEHPTIHELPGSRQGLVDEK